MRGLPQANLSTPGLRKRDNPSPMFLLQQLPQKPLSLDDAHDDADDDDNENDDDNDNAQPIICPTLS